MIHESSISFQAGKSNDDEKSDNNNTNQITVFRHRQQTHNRSTILLVARIEFVHAYKFKNETCRMQRVMRRHFVVS
jgi:hypothetical protein